MSLRKEERKETSEGCGTLVATHYNKIPEIGLSSRSESRIFYLRNFNNWIKSVLLANYVHRVKKSFHYPHLTVLDLACGKGGDLNKWKMGGISRLVGVDIASQSLSDAQNRYKDLRKKSSRNFEAEFLLADVTKDNLKDKFSQNYIFQLVSCQFAFHYSFESLAQTEKILQNISDSLAPGGFFIGTTPDSNEIVYRVRGSSDSKSVSNSVYSISFEKPLTDVIPLFGAKYTFRLQGAVHDCPEFLVHFPTFVILAAKFGLTLVAKQRFENYFKENLNSSLFLLKRMKALCSFPQDKIPGFSYTSAKEFFDKKENLSYNNNVGTMSDEEWAVTSLYLVFAFKKNI